MTSSTSPPSPQPRPPLDVGDVARRSLTRGEIVRLRIHSNGLHRRSPLTPSTLRDAAWAGCQDSVPRAAVLSLHARVDGVQHDILGHDGLAQVWGPGYSAYVVPAEDIAVFTFGRLPESGSRRAVVEQLAAALAPILADGPITYREAGRLLGVNPNQLRYAGLTGTVALHWAGSGQPEISALPAPKIDRAEAANELGRRFLRVYGPATRDDFARWAGVSKRHARSVFTALQPECVPVDTPIGPALLHETSIAALDEFNAEGDSDGGAEIVRLLPSGDALYLNRGDQRELLVPDVHCREELWTSRVWPGAVLANGRIIGTWRRKANRMSVTLWESRDDELRAAVETEARSLPLPEPVDDIGWDSPT